MPSLPTGTVTFLFTDIEGSTRLLQQLGDRYADVLATHHGLLRTAIQETQGHVVDTQGDAVFAAFPRARDALLAAIAAQRAVQAHPWPDGITPKLRAGLHTGEPVTGETGYVGMDVHRAARIAAAGHGGQTLLSDTTHALVAKDLPQGIELRDLGEHRLKDLAHAHRLFQVVAVDLLADFPPIRSLDAHPHNLPIQLTSFIGRAREIAEVKRLLGAARLVTLTGSGGAGKTRLALQVAADVVEGYPDGVWLAEFAPIADPALVPKTVASALNVPEQPERDMMETLVHALRPKALLLVLDNCEHLLAACADLAAALLRACPQVRILATSREGLGVPGETLWRVPSLSLPDVHHLPPSEDLVLYEAVRLFVDRAVAATPGFTVTGQNALAVAQVCHRLDGIPLAIELAAARVKVITVEQIAVRLDDRFRLLTGGSRMVLPRQQTLRAAVDWSYDLLSEIERGLLRRLSVFAGGWTLEAAEGICTGQGVEASNVLDLLTHLVDKSLVVVERPEGEARYHMLETVRQYSVNRLVESDEAADVRTRHLNWYVAMGEGAYPDVLESRSRRREATLKRLRTEHDNLRGALAWSLEKNAEAGLALAGALGQFWNASSQYGEGRAWLTTVLGRTRRIPSLARARALRYAALLAWVQGEYHEAAVLSEEGLTLARQMQHTEQTAGLLFVLGVANRDAGNYERAARLLEECQGLYQELGLTERAADIMRHRGRLAANQGDYALATALLERALDLYRETGSKDGIAYTLLQLGVVRRYQRDHAPAVDLLEKSLAIFRELGATEGMVHALNGLARILRQTGQDERALRLYAESLTLSRACGVKLAIQGCFYGMASVNAAQGQRERAARLFAAAEDLRAGIGYALPARDRDEYDGTVTAIRETMGDVAFVTAWAEGRAMTLEQAIEYALEERLTPQD
jgi:predicted ATPase/class 3 adenylate cyclase